MIKKDMLLNRPEVNTSMFTSPIGQPFLVKVSKQFPTKKFRKLVGRVIVVSYYGRWSNGNKIKTESNELLVLPCEHNDRLLGSNAPRLYKEGYYTIKNMWLEKLPDTNNQSATKLKEENPFE